MESANLLHTLFEHRHWANLAVLDSLRMTDDNEAARRLFSHILAADLVWQDRLTGKAADTSGLWKTLSLAELEHRHDEVYAKWQDFLESLKTDPGLLHKKIAYTNARGQSHENSVQEILMHAVLHAQYHRAQVATLIKSGGFAPPVTDFMMFLWN